MKTTVFITLSVEGVHHWPDCNLEEVGFLRHPHRHLFGVKCHFPVKHDRRDIEFIVAKRSVRFYLLKKYGKGDGVCDFGSMSCEMIAKDLLENFGLVKCSVDEDGENGAEVEL